MKDSKSKALKKKMKEDKEEKKEKKHKRPFIKEHDDEEDEMGGEDMK